MLYVGQKLQIPGDSGSSKRYYHSCGFGTWRLVNRSCGDQYRYFKESDLNLDIGMRLTSLLRSDGYTVVATRDSDIDVPLWKRVEIANSRDADIFVSIHADYNINYPQTGGSNVYVRQGANSSTQQLANTVQMHLESGTGRSTNVLGRVVQENFTVVVQPRPAILIEVGFNKQK